MRLHDLKYRGVFSSLERDGRVYSIDGLIKNGETFFKETAVSLGDLIPRIDFSDTSYSEFLREIMLVIEAIKRRIPKK